jgi:hypothetical protein
LTIISYSCHQNSISHARVQGCTAD